MKSIRSSQGNLTVEFFRESACFVNVKKKVRGGREVESRFGDRRRWTHVGQTLRAVKTPSEPMFLVINYHV
jgi:hypothetical protein